MLYFSFRLTCRSLLAEGKLNEVRCISCHGVWGTGRRGSQEPVVQKDAEPDLLSITIHDGRAENRLAAFAKKRVWD